MYKIYSWRDTVLKRSDIVIAVLFTFTREQSFKEFQLVSVGC